MFLSLSLIACLAAYSTANLIADHEHPGEYHEQEGLALFHWPAGNLIEDHYIVMLRDNETVAEHLERINMTASSFVKFSEIDIVNGYSCVTDNVSIHDIIRADPAVQIVEQNVELEVYPDIEPTVLNGSSWDATVPHDQDIFNTTQSPGSYIRQGLGMVQRSIIQHLKRWTHVDTPAGDGNLYYRTMITQTKKLDVPVKNNNEFTVRQLPDGGIGVHVYILDSGIRLSHQAFAGRAVNFKDMTTTPYTIPDYLPMSDENDNLSNRGHGTHVAGLVGGTGLGLATGATLVNVRIANEKRNGNLEGFVRALRDVRKEHNDYAAQSAQGKIFNWRGSVINLSLGAASNAALQRAIVNANRAGIAIVAAAGNAGKEVATEHAPCFYRSDSINFFCVGATDQSYNRADPSNFGKQLTTVAPGIDIKSCTVENDHGLVIRTGTSMATPLVAGVVAIMMSWENIADNVNLLLERVSQNAQTGIISGFDRGSGDNSMGFLNSGIEYDNGLPYKNAPQFAVSPDQRSVQPWDPNQVGLPDPGVPDIVTTATYDLDPSSPTSYPDDTEPDISFDDNLPLGLSCTSSSNSWDSQPQLVEWARDFCKNLEVSNSLEYSFTYTESDGKQPTIDKAKFYATWTVDNGIPSINDCQHILIDLIINGCDTKTYYDWKQGGNYTTTGSIWSIEPLAPRNPPDELTYGDNRGAIIIESFGNTGLNNIPLDKGTLQQCLDSTKTISPVVLNPTLFQQDCGNLHWELGKVNWASLENCQVGCVKSLSAAINNDANTAWCNIYDGSAHCWLGFYINK